MGDMANIYLKNFSTMFSTFVDDLVHMGAVLQAVGGGDKANDVVESIVDRSPFAIKVRGWEKQDRLDRMMADAGFSMANVSDHDGGALVILTRDVVSFEQLTRKVDAVMGEGWLGPYEGPDDSCSHEHDCCGCTRRGGWTPLSPMAFNGELLSCVWRQTWSRNV
jgi:hypothetical protein